MKAEMAARGPIACSLCATDEFEAYAGGIFRDATNCTDLNHSIEIAGWGEEGGVKFWVGRNSWGTYWWAALLALAVNWQPLFPTNSWLALPELRGLALLGRWRCRQHHTGPELMVSVPARPPLLRVQGRARLVPAGHGQGRPGRGAELRLGGTHACGLLSSLAGPMAA